MASEQKGPVSFQDMEVERQLDSSVKAFHRVDSLRTALSSLALLCSIAILGTAAHTLLVYQQTHLPQVFNLPLWPADLDSRPTEALLAGSVFVLLANIISLCFSRIQTLRSIPRLHTLSTLVAPFVGFVAVMVAMIFFYAVNASATKDTLQSWSCTWEHTVMLTDPHFDSLCRESKTALYLSVVLVPLELIIITAAGYQIVVGKKADRLSQTFKPGSPALSS